MISGSHGTFIGSVERTTNVTIDAIPSSIRTSDKHPTALDIATNMMRWHTDAVGTSGTGDVLGYQKIVLYLIAFKTQAT